MRSLRGRTGADRQRNRPQFPIQVPLGTRQRLAAMQHPRLDVALTDDLLLRRILHKLMTNEFIATALEEATGSPQGDPTGEHGFTKREVKSLKDDPEGFVASIGGTLAARKFLGGFIAEIQIQTDRAVVCYSIPLPNTNPLAGRYQQHIWLSEISLD